jgi:glucose-1-phosphate cytidylyltransferase
MVEVGGKPILWHIMKNLSVQGINEFTIATGYKGDLVKDYFLNYYSRNNDVTVDLGQKSSVIHHGSHDESKWKVTITNTGEFTMTGGRVHRSLKYLDGERFLCTYGDGLADVDIKNLIEFHTSHGKKATVTTVQPLSRFGVMDVDQNGVVTQFREKPVMDG